MELISYDANDGTVSQSFTLDFVPQVKYISCNDNYLALVDTLGNVHIYKYSRPLPVWAIVLIVIGSLLVVGIIGGIIVVIISKRRQSKKESNK